MTAFLKWFNGTDDTDPVLRAGLAHLWFVTIHPFDDGNGRIARAIADMALARSEESPQRFYSMSAQIRLERKTYYDMLEKTQKGNLDVTPWLEWFLGCLNRAFDATEKTLGSVLRKARFWETHANTPFNDRQRLMLNRLLDGFEGKLTSSKWAKIAKTSQDTALRDIGELVERGILDQGRRRRAQHKLFFDAGRRTSVIFVQDALSKVKVIVDETIPEPGPYCPVSVELKNGSRFTYTARIAKGHPDNPMTEAEVLDKFRSNAKQALSQESSEAVIVKMRNLEAVPNVKELVALLTT